MNATLLTKTAKAMFAAGYLTVGGLAASVATAIVAPVFVPLAGAITLGAIVATTGLGAIMGTISQKDVDAFHERITDKQKKRAAQKYTALRGLTVAAAAAAVIGTAATVAAVIVAPVFLPLAGAVAAAATIVTGGIYAMNDFEYGPRTASEKKKEAETEAPYKKALAKTFGNISLTAMFSTVAAATATAAVIPLAPALIPAAGAVAAASAITFAGTKTIQTSLTTPKP